MACATPDTVNGTEILSSAVITSEWAIASPTGSLTTLQPADILVDGMCGPSLSSIGSGSNCSMCRSTNTHFMTS